MKRAGIVVFIAGGIVLTPGPRAAEAGATARSNEAFAFGLYAQLRHGGGNIFVSPYGIWTCLAMTYAGARGETEAQMSHALHLDEDQAQCPAEFKRLKREIERATNSIQLSVVNALWTRKGEHLLPEFLSVVREDYDATGHEVDFAAHPEVALEAVNHWITRQTHGRIQDLVPAEAVDSQTALILANAIYFKAAWDLQFEPGLTSRRAFHLVSGHAVSAPTMYEDAYPKIFETNDFRALELSYAGRAASMLILLPRQIDGVPSIEQRLGFNIYHLSNDGSELMPIPFAQPAFNEGNGDWNFAWRATGFEPVTPTV